MEILNLCELLKGCEGLIFYSKQFGDVTLELIHNNLPSLQVRTLDNKCYWYNANSKIDGKGPDDLYPSKNLCDQYPFDVISAWNEWNNVIDRKYGLSIYIPISLHNTKENSYKYGIYKNNVINTYFESKEEMIKSIENLKNYIQENFKIKLN